MIGGLVQYLGTGDLQCRRVSRGVDPVRGVGRGSRCSERVVYTSDSTSPSVLWRVQQQTRARGVPPNIQREHCIHHKEDLARRGGMVAVRGTPQSEQEQGM